MSTFQKADQSVHDIAGAILKRFDTHKPLINLGVKIDIVMAFADLDENGQPVGEALKLHGVKALGLAKIMAVKERVMGRGDAEISLDGDWWSRATEEQQAALLDHELHHLSVAVDKNANPKYDDIGRPKLKMRLHDHDFGWFSTIAVRHGMASQECLQAKQMFQQAGQYYWPELTTTSAASLTEGLKKAAKKFNADHKDATMTVLDK